MLAMTAGYFIASFLARGGNTTMYISKHVLLLSLISVALPAFSSLCFQWFGGFNFWVSLLISSFLLIVPVVIINATFSPLIIQKLSNDEKNNGRIAGRVYGIGTLGGICAVFLLGYFIIPQIGVEKAIGLLSAVLLLFGRFILIAEHKPYWTAVLFFSIVMQWGINKGFSLEEQNTVYSSEGLLGKVKVIDYKESADSNKWYGRVLLVNNITQSAEEGRAYRYKYLPNVQRMDELITSANNKRALVLGLGAGSVAKVLYAKGFTVDACELDERIADIAKNYFSLPSDINVSINDARAFVNTCNQKYKYIVIDVYKGEESPSHLITKESLDKIKKLLSDSGTILINTFGYLDGRLGLGNRSVIKTFIDGGFNVSIVNANPEVKQIDFRNLVFVIRKNLNEFKYNGLGKIFPIAKVNLNDAHVLTDDNSNLDYLNAYAAQRWRYYYIKLNKTRWGY